jgi:protein-export membrane protein SecD
MDATKLFKGKTDSAKVATTDNKTEIGSKDKPFTSLLNQGPYGELIVAEKNKLKIDRFLSMDPVRIALGKYEFVWKNKALVNAQKEKFYELTLVNRQVEMDGLAIEDASALMSQGDAATGGWEVSLQLTDRGTKKFENITGKNVGKRLAIILDGKLIMAPNINERIAYGRAQISGSMDAIEARDLANVLTSALPAPIEIIEKRVIGPSLGKDAIKSGLMSAIIGYVLVLLFLVFYYKLSGLFALVTISLNTFLMIAVLCFFKATMTLPGIAGAVLSMAMAVDANVLIFERIKEELANGKTVFSALNAGYEKAFSAIFDSNITTILAGIVLYQYGTGPIRGFALTLLAGVVINLYTAVVVTRLLQDMFVKKDTAKISI